jgi:predicted O-linked N-acetylglucosamine transferase (SPINDLY family)
VTPNHPDANHNLGVLAVSVGKIDQALPLFLRAIEANARSEQFWLSYVDALVKSNQANEAFKISEEARRAGVSKEKLERLTGRSEKMLPSDQRKLSEISGRAEDSAEPDGAVLESTPSEHEINRLIESYEIGRPAEAAILARSFSQQFPSHPLGWKILGVALLRTGKISEALIPMQKAAFLVPQDAEAHSNLGVTFKKLGQFKEAEASYRQAVQLEPSFASAHNNLGVVLSTLGKLDGAESSYRKAISLDPRLAEAHNNLGMLLQNLGQLEQAEISYRKAIAVDPDYAEAHSNLGVLLQFRGKWQAAVQMGRQAVSLKPDFADAHCNLGNALQKLGQLDEAAATCRRAIKLMPEHVKAHNNLGNALMELGRFDKAAASYREAFRIDSRYRKAQSNLLFVLNYDPTINSADLFREYEAYGEVVAGLTKRSFAHDDRPPVEGRRIRVGYSSPDFRGHSCRFFMEPIFRNHNRGQFELFAYSNTSNPDQHTERMKSYFDHWVDVVRMSDEEMAQRVYDDQIDILVDMAGHTAGNRLPVFAMRPAPIQASSSIGFGYTTGLKEVDYFICDENLVPAGSEAYFSEEPLRLPAPCLAYAPPRDVIPDISELPALSKGYVTFGSLTRPVRLNDPLLRVWGEILERVPGSRLRLDQKPFAHEGTREMFWERLEGLGIARDRVDLTCSSPHWDAYREIDITLDCWPHNAGTTTIESLWMGVPVLSKLDRVSVGRVGAMILEPLGLGDWLVESEEDYVARAVAAASDLDSLTSLRSALRQRIEKSRLVDEVAFVKNLENTLKQMVSLREGTST